MELLEWLEHRILTKKAMYNLYRSEPELDIDESKKTQLKGEISAYEEVVYFLSRKAKK